MNDPNLLYVPLKLVVYWMAILLVFHGVPQIVGAGEPLPARVAVRAAGARFVLGLLFGLPLALLSIQMEVWTILAVFLVARLAAWLVALRRYMRHDGLRTAVFALAMTGLNFLLDRLVLGDWLAAGLANFHMC